MGVQQHRKNPRPVVRAAYGNGIFLLAHGEPHDPCPVEGCAGELRFAPRGDPVVCGLQCAAAAPGLPALVRG
jgi:hypothetical protein